MNKVRKAKLMPIGKNGKEIDWFYGWPGIEKLAAGYGKSWLDVGELIEDTWGDRTTFEDLNFAYVIYHSLDLIKHGKIKKRPVPNNETDIHFVIRTNRQRLQQLWKKENPGKNLPKDFQKSARQKYNEVMKKRSAFVKAMKQEFPNK